MRKRDVNNVKLGLFVLAGLVFLILLLYMIGKNRSLFGNTYTLKARFENVQGLVSGNNVRFAGIQAGTVKRIRILNDTVIEVTMIIDTKMKKIIRKNAIASIGTDGLVGNKVINIVPDHQPASLAEAGDILVSKKQPDTEDMLETLQRTNKNVAVVVDGLKTTVDRINNSRALWDLLNDNSLPMGLRNAVGNLRQATSKAAEMVDELRSLIADVKDGKGSAGMLLTDTTFASNLNEAVEKIKKVGDGADSLAGQMSRMISGLQQDIDHGKGTVHALLKDSSIVTQLNSSLENIQMGTDKFNQNMEALKHNFFFRGYFRRLEKQKRKEAQ